jgi:hypothetical protein
MGILFFPRRCLGLKSGGLSDLRIMLWQKKTAVNVPRLAESGLNLKDSDNFGFIFVRKSFFNAVFGKYLLFFCPGFAPSASSGLRRGMPERRCYASLRSPRPKNPNLKSSLKSRNPRLLQKICENFPELFSVGLGRRGKL